MTAREKYMYLDGDHISLALAFREAGNKLAEAAGRVVTSGDGRHRLCLALANWYQVVGDERVNYNRLGDSEKI